MPEEPLHSINISIQHEIDIKQTLLEPVLCYNDALLNMNVIIDPLIYFLQFPWCLVSSLLSSHITCLTPRLHHSHLSTPLLMLSFPLFCVPLQLHVYYSPKIFLLLCLCSRGGFSSASCISSCLFCVFIIHISLKPYVFIILAPWEPPCPSQYLLSTYS